MASSIIAYRAPARPARLVLEVPVAAPATLAALRAEIDEVACIESPSALGAIGAFYLHYTQVGDMEVMAMLDEARRLLAGAAAAGQARPGRE